MKQMRLLVLATAWSFTVTLPAAAQEPQSVREVDAMTACRAIADAAERAACYDASVGAFTEALESGELALVERRAVREVEREGFGLPLPSLEGIASVFSRSGGRADDTAQAAREPSVETLEDGATAEYDRSGRLGAVRGAPVRSVEYNNRGRMVIELENGQVWLQTDSDRVMTVRDRHFERGLTAEIERGLLGSFSMKLSHSPRDAFSVERIR
jgi:hypothetical protein